jgi:hypothetical protein
VNAYAAPRKQGERPATPIRLVVGMCEDGEQRGSFAHIVSTRWNVRRTFRRCVAHLLSRADRFHFGDPFFDRFGFGLQIFQVCLQLGNSLCARRKPSLEMNLRTFAALVAIAFTLPTTLVLATATSVATTFALML